MGKELELKVQRLRELKEKMHKNPMAFNEKDYRELVDELFQVTYEALVLAGDQWRRGD